MSDPELIRAAIDASGLSARRFAESILSRDERTVRRWRAGAPIPASARARLVWFLGLHDAQRRRLVEICACALPRECR